MKYVLLLDPNDSCYAVWMYNQLGWHHLTLGWVNTQDLALRRFANRDTLVEPRLVTDPSTLLQRVQVIIEFTVDTHPEYFL